MPDDRLLPLPRILIEPVVRAALLEDLGRAGDITTDAIVPPSERMEAVIASRQDGVSPAPTRRRSPSS